MKLFSLFMRFVDFYISTKETVNFRLFLNSNTTSRQTERSFPQLGITAYLASCDQCVFLGLHIGDDFFFSPNPPSELNSPAKPCDAFCRLLCSEIKMLGRPGIKATGIELKESWLICNAVKSKCTELLLSGRRRSFTTLSDTLAYLY